MGPEGTPQAPADPQDTPTDSAPPGEDTREATPPAGADTGEEQQTDVDWEKRYNDLRPEFDRKSEALKEAEQARELVQALQSEDPTERAWAYETLGLEPVEDDAEDTPDDDEFRDPRVDKLLEERQAEQQQAQLAELERHIDTQIDTLAKKDSVSLDDQDREWIWSRTLALPPADGKPDVAKAFGEFKGMTDAWIKRYRESKRDAPTPPPGGGSPGSTQVHPGSRTERLERANQIAQRALTQGQ